MAIKKLYNGNYQARLEGPDGRYLTRVFSTKAQAEEQERRWKQQKRERILGTVSDQKVSVDNFFWEWFQALRDSTSKEEDTGWREAQEQLYRDYVFPVIGSLRLRNVTPQCIKKVLNSMAKQGKSTQTRRHVYGMLRKMFGDAIEDYQYLAFNPVLKKLRPDVHVTEAAHLKNVDQIKRLLLAAEGQFFELAVWIQVYTGLRIGEIQAIRWSEIDLEAGTLSVKRAFVRKRNQIREYPKGKKQFTLCMPPELWKKLREAGPHTASEFVVTSLTGTMLQYKSYLKGLRRMCKGLDLPHLGTHGLRHTTSSIYRKHGASKEDMRELFSHSSMAVTERYLHSEGSNLHRVANEIRLFQDHRPEVDPTPPILPEPNKNRTKLRLVASR